MNCERVLLDLSLLVAASVEVHPANQSARAYVEKLKSEQTPTCITPQICREFLATLTRQPVSGKTFTPAEAIEALDEWASVAGDDFKRFDAEVAVDALTSQLHSSSSSLLLPATGHVPQAVGPEHVVCEKSNVSQWPEPQVELFVQGSAQNSLPCESATQQSLPPQFTVAPTQQS